MEWKRAPLDADGVRALDSVTWRALPRDTVLAVAEGWNAGMTTADMAADLGCRPASLRIMIGRLIQCGVPMRRAVTPGLPAALTPPPARSPLADRIGAEQMARLRRLAPFDKAAARTLALMERGAA